MTLRHVLALCLLFSLPSFAGSPQVPVEGRVLAARPLQLSGHEYTSVTVKLRRCGATRCRGSVNLLFSNWTGRLARGVKLELRLPASVMHRLNRYKNRHGRARVALVVDSPPRTPAAPTKLASAR